MSSSAENMSKTAAKCVNCALVKHTVSEYQILDMNKTATYFVPAVFFLILSMRWSYLLITRWRKNASDQQLHMTGLPPTPDVAHWSGCRPLPWEGISKIVMSTMATGATLLLSFDLSSLKIITLYGFFAISGLVDLLIFSFGYLVLPEGIQSLILSFCFVVESFVFYSLSSATTVHLHRLLILLLSASAVTSILELVYEARLIKYCRCLFTLIQSSWLFHIGMLADSTDSINAEWAAIYLSWHIGLAFLITLVILALMSSCVKTVPKYILPSLTSSMISSPWSSPHLLSTERKQILTRPSSLPLGEAMDRLSSPQTEFSWCGKEDYNAKNVNSV